MLKLIQINVSSLNYSYFEKQYIDYIHNFYRLRVIYLTRRLKNKIVIIIKKTTRMDILKDSICSNNFFSNKTMVVFMRKTWLSRI